MLLEGRGLFGISVLWAVWVSDGGPCRTLQFFIMVSVGLGLRRA